MVWIAIIAAIYLAFNLGANDVANSMGTSVGSKAITLTQALVIAGVLELAGVLLFGQAVSSQLATGVVAPEYFIDRPINLTIGMLAVLIATGIWMNLATLLGLPVSSSHAAVGALAGVGLVSIGPQAVQWSQLSVIALTWILTPVLSALLAALLYRGVQQVITSQRLTEWIPWLSALMMTVFGTIVLPTVVTQFQWNLFVPTQTATIGLTAIATIGLTYRLLLQSNPDPRPESIFAVLQIVSACFVAFAHGSNDVGNAIAPLAVIIQIQRTGTVPLQHLDLPFWLLALGGGGIVAGLAIGGRRVMATIGAGIIPLQPSGGFCAELATAMTILLASRAGLPVSTSHALVGGVVGVGLTQGWKQIQTSTLRSIGLTWGATIPLSAGLAALCWVGLDWWLGG
jgi:inorganic phosphate transporter, PiT family